MSIAASAMLHFCASNSNVDMAEIYPEYISNGLKYSDVNFDIKNGFAELKDRPGLGVKINVKSQILGDGSYAKYFYISYENEEFVLDIDDLELKEKSTKVKTKYHMLEPTDYVGNNFIFEKKMRTLLVKSTDGIMELTFNAETRGMLIKSRIDFTQENSTGVMMSNSIDDCIRTKLDE